MLTYKRAGCQSEPPWSVFVSTQLNPARALYRLSIVYKATKHLQQITCHSALTSQPVLQCLLSWRHKNWSLGNWSVKRDYEDRMAVVSVERMALSSSGTPSLMSQCVAVG